MWRMCGMSQGVIELLDFFGHYEFIHLLSVSRPSFSDRQMHLSKTR